MVNNKYIFVIVDSAETRELIRMLYEAEGYIVSTAGDGQEALNILRKSHELPSLILLDLIMPGMDGFGFRKEQEKDSKLIDIPVVIMTADSKAEAKAVSIGAHGHLMKPIAVNTLLEIAKKYCKSS